MSTTTVDRLAAPQHKPRRRPYWLRPVTLTVLAGYLLSCLFALASSHYGGGPIQTFTPQQYATEVFGFGEGYAWGAPGPSMIAPFDLRYLRSEMELDSDGRPQVVAVFAFRALFEEAEVTLPAARVRFATRQSSPAPATDIRWQETFDAYQTLPDGTNLLPADATARGNRLNGPSLLGFLCWQCDAAYYTPRIEDSNYYGHLNGPHGPQLMVEAIESVRVSGLEPTMATATR